MTVKMTAAVMMMMKMTVRDDSDCDDDTNCDDDDDCEDDSECDDDSDCDDGNLERYC